MVTPSIACPVWFIVVLATETKSGNPIATARELFFVRFSIWLVSGGIMTLNACGKITRFKIKREGTIFITLTSICVRRERKVLFFFQTANQQRMHLLIRVLYYLYFENHSHSFQSIQDQIILFYGSCTRY